MKLSAYLRLIRLHQPTGTWLLLWPCWWAAALLSPDLPGVLLLAAFALGAFCMRASGCIINDWWDREVDAKVERTRHRPLASGELTPAQALVLLALLLAASLGVAIYLHVVLWSALSLPLVAAYPLMKRFTWWPQAFFLGLTFNWGALLGAVAVRGHISLPALLLYAGGIGWTLGYDTIYAHQDKAYDAEIGVKSTALRLGDETKPWLLGFYGAAVLCWVLAGANAHAGELYFAVMTVVAAHLACQVRTVKLDEPASCVAVFKSNAWLGLIVFAACMLGKAG